MRSPTIGTSAARILPISAGSMSTCTTLAFGANSAALPVTRSSKRAPSETSRSASCSASTAGTVPCMPGMPRCCWCESGNAPRAISVVTTGAPVVSASASSSADACARMTPPPTYSTGFFAVGEQLRRGLDLLAVRLGDRAVAGQVDLRRPDERRLGLLRVLGDVDEHRTGATRAGDLERRRDRGGDVLGALHQERVLRDRHRDADDVGLLEGIRPHQVREDLAGDADDRHRVHVGVGDRGDEVGRAGAGGRDGDADLVGCRGVALGGVTGALLVAHQDVAQLGLSMSGS